MIELTVGLTFLFSLWVFGRSLILACNKDDCDWLAMPIGLCLVGLIGNMLYFMFGLTVQSAQLLFLCALIPCLIVVFRKGICRGEWSRLMAVLGVFLLLALPAYIGGEQYYVFRGNHWDHFNYINQALTLWCNPYPVYHNALVNKFLAQDILVHGIPFISARPAVGLVFAMLLPDGRGNIHLLAFLYVTALLALVFPAICFAWKRVLEAYGLGKSSLLLLMGPPFAYVAGFWGQYIFDINAWSEMAALSLLLALVFQYLRLLQNLADPSTLEGKSIASQYVLTGALAAGSFLFYPENTVLHAGFLLLATLWWCAVTRKIPGFRALVSFAIFSVAVILISSIPYWDGTAQFVISQIKSVPGNVADYWKYFDRYWLGIHGHVLFSQIKPAVVHGLNLRGCFDKYWHEVHVFSGIGYISTFANFILALTGMFFVTPDYSMPFCIRYGWIFITVILSMMAVYSLAAGLFVRFKVNQTAIFLKAFFLSGILFLLYLLKTKAIWSFGKGLSFLSPYLFLVLCLGLIAKSNTWGDRLIRIFVIIFIMSQIAFGAYRLWTARDPKGIGYDSLTYPSIEDPAMKTKYLWHIDPHAYADCRGVYLQSVADPFYMEYMKQKFIYLKMPYFSSGPVMTYYNLGDQVGFQEPIIADCKAAPIKQAGKWVMVRK